MRKTIFVLVLMAVATAVCCAEAGSSGMFIEATLAPIGYSGTLGKYVTSFSGNAISLDLGIPAEKALFTVGVQVVNQSVTQSTSTEFYSNFLYGVNFTLKARIYLGK